MRKEEIKRYDELVRAYRKEGCSWKEAQKRSDEIFEEGR